MRSLSFIAAGVLAVGLGSTALADGGAWGADLDALLQDALPSTVDAFGPDTLGLGYRNGSEGRPVVVIVPPTTSAASAPWYQHEPRRFETGLIACINDKAMFRDERGRRSFIDPPAAAQYCG